MIPIIGSVKAVDVFPSMGPNSWQQSWAMVYPDTPNIYEFVTKVVVVRFSPFSPLLYITNLLSFASQGLYPVVKGTPMGQTTLLMRPGFGYDSFNCGTGHSFTAMPEVQSLQSQFDSLSSVVAAAMDSMQHLSTVLDACK